MNDLQESDGKEFGVGGKPGGPGGWQLKPPGLLVEALKDGYKLRPEPGSRE